MDKVTEACEQMDLSWVKDRVGSFTLQMDRCDDEKAYRLFHYENDLGWRWEALYDREVEDYTVHISMPLFSFTDISFIRQEPESYLAGLRERCEAGLTMALVEPDKSFTHAYKAKKLPQWQWQSFLPTLIDDYQLDITPDRAIRMINGSYIIAEYRRKEDRSGLLLFYNVLRDEFFAELRRHNHPEISHELDARTLPSLEKALTQHLERILKELTTRL